MTTEARIQWTSAARALALRLLVALFAAVTVSYGAAWMYYYQVVTATAELGFTPEYSETEDAVIAASVNKGSPAQVAGLLPGDRIVAAQGIALDTRDRFNAWQHSRLREQITLTVRRPGTDTALNIRPTVAAPSSLSLLEIAQWSLLELLTFYPMIYLAVGLAVLTLRPTDLHAWLMAALFASFVSIPEFPHGFGGLPPHLSAFVRGYRTFALAAFPALFYGFFAVFPARSPLDRRLPWLKWLNVGGCLLFAFPSLALGVPTQTPLFLQHWFGTAVADTIRLTYLFGGTPLGVLALAGNATSAASTEARRKARVLLWGTVIGVSPVFLEPAARTLGGWQVPTSITAMAVVVSFVFPLSFAYAVVKHRVLDIPVLLRRSARYVLVRQGSLVLIAVLGTTATALFAVYFSRVFAVNPTVATAVGVAFGFVLTIGSSQLIRRSTTRIDRAFFRSAYDATAILENLAETILGVTSPEAVASLLERQISEALQPDGMIVYLTGHDGSLDAQASRWSQPAPALRADAPWLRELARRGRPWDVSTKMVETPPPSLAGDAVECVVPIVGYGERLLGLLVLGMRASEETYSRDDKRLLQSVASQSGIALENIRLAEEIAQRLDADRVASREMEIAREVQSRLFPQTQPALNTLDYAGGCVQARRVGGDYYDFVALGPERVGLVVADIAGKGIAGALLMANLQANLRSQYATAADDLPRLLKAVNQLFYENTSESQYATLFFADYSDTTKRLRYANCGHFPPYLMRSDGSYEPLMPTGTVLGLFERWTATICERELFPGDTLVIYTDGVIEASNALEEEFGAERLLQTIRSHQGASAAALVSAIHEGVQTFSKGVLSDDVTVVVAKVR